MKHKKLRFGQRFRVAIGNRRSQAAEMVIPPGGGEGDPRNRHRSAAVVAIRHYSGSFSAWPALLRAAKFNLMKAGPTTFYRLRLDY